MLRLGISKEAHTTRDLRDLYRKMGGVRMASNILSLARMGDTGYNEPKKDCAPKESREWVGKSF